MSKLSSFLLLQLEQRGWSKADLADHAGIPRTTITRWTNPGWRGQISHDNIQQLASGLGMNPNDLLKYIGYPVRASANGDEREQRWNEIRALLDADPRAGRILELFEGATEDGRDTALTILEAHFAGRRRRR